MTLEKWQEYWQHMRKHALRSFVYLPPLIIIFFASLNYFEHDGRGSYLTYIGMSSIVTYTIAGFIYVSYALFYLIPLLLRAPESAAIGIDENIGVHIALCLGSIAAGLYFSDFLLVAIYGTLRSTTSEWISDVMMGAVIGLIFSLLYAYLKTRDAVAELEKTTVENRYQTLKDQMQPHFLFNTLNGLTELIHQNAIDAANMATRMADLYRGILENSKQKTSSLTSELAIVDDYLTLQKLRFGDKLSYKITGDRPINEVYLPSLMLQTLVENAIKHGIEKSQIGGEIIIENRRSQDHWPQISIRNSGKALKIANETGTGLKNTRSRLDLIYGDRHNFKLNTTPEGWTEASFCFSGEHIA